MNILIYEPNDSLGTFLNDYMFSIGLIPYVTDNVNVILPQLRLGHFDLFLTNYSLEEEVINNVIFNLKLDRELERIKIFIITPNPEKIVLQNLIKLGIHGFVKKPFLEQQFKETFEMWLDKNSFSEDKRRFIRIVPQPSDNAFAFIKTKYSASEIPFKIQDISIGGTSFIPPEEFQKYMLSYFTIGDTIRDVRLKIRHFGITVNIKVVKVFKESVNFTFVNGDEKFNKYIYRYIADSLEFQFIS